MKSIQPSRLFRTMAVFYKEMRRFLWLELAVLAIATGVLMFFFSSGFLGSGDLATRMVQYQTALVNLSIAVAFQLAVTFAMTPHGYAGKRLLMLPASNVEKYTAMMVVGILSTMTMVALGLLLPTYLYGQLIGSLSPSFAEVFGEMGGQTVLHFLSPAVLRVLLVLLWLIPLTVYVALEYRFWSLWRMVLMGMLTLAFLVWCIYVQYDAQSAISMRLWNILLWLMWFLWWVYIAYRSFCQLQLNTHKMKKEN